LVQELIESGVSVNCIDGLHYTPLHFAAESGHSAIVWYLLEKGACVNAVNDHGETPLLLACVAAQKDTVEKLLSKSANPNRPNKFYYSPLHLIAQEISKQHLSNIRISFTHDGKKDNLTDLKTLNDWKIQNKYLTLMEIASILLENGADVHAKTMQGTTVLHHAASFSGTTDFIELLLNHGANVNEVDDEYNHALHYAAKKNQHENIRLLIKHGAFINSQNNNGYTALHEAAIHDSREAAEALVAAGADAWIIAVNGEFPSGICACDLAFLKNKRKTGDYLKLVR
jgi:ankyrin repeat protein